MVDYLDICSKTYASLNEEKAMRGQSLIDFIDEEIERYASLGLNTLSFLGWIYQKKYCYLTTSEIILIQRYLDILAAQGFEVSVDAIEDSDNKKITIKWEATQMFSAEEE